MQLPHPHDVPLMRRLPWPAAPARCGTFAYAPPGFAGRACLVETGSGIGAIPMQGIWPGQRRLVMPGGHWLKLRLQLEGRTRLRFLGRREEIDRGGPRMALIWHPPELAKEQVSEAGAAEHAVTLRLPLGPDRLPAGFEDFAGCTLHGLLHRLTAAPALLDLPLSPAMAVCVRRMLDQAPSPETIQAFSEAALAELCSWLSPEAARLGAADRRRIMLARELLEESAVAPPSLDVLARRVGLNRNTLNSGFRVLYGATAFALLRRRRLDHARLLVRGTELSLTAIAQRCGFRHASNFSTAYLRRFGHPPSADRRQPGTFVRRA